MVLTNGQVTAFFEFDAQMGIPHATVIQLQAEGITSVDDLIDFDKDTLQQVADNLRRPGGRIPDPTPNAAAGATISTPPFVFGAKSQKRLLSACDIVRYYYTTGRALTPGNISWDPVIKNFADQWKALKDRKIGEVPEVPKITKALPVIKWTEAFEDFIHRIIGVRMISLAYVIRETVAVPAAAPGLMPGQPHSEEHGSVEAELVARAVHTHALYRDDNAQVYYLLEEATRTTSYSASIKPFQRRKDGRAAWLALTSQYAGQDKWEQELKKQDGLLHTRVWRGQNNFTLERFVQQHRNPSMSNTISLLSTLGSDTFFMVSSATMLGSRPRWQASRLPLLRAAYERILKEHLHTCSHTIPLPRNVTQTMANEEPPRSRIRLVRKYPVLVPRKASANLESTSATTNRTSTKAFREIKRMNYASGV